MTGQPTSLPHLYSGKVRELYEVSHDRLLMVASDRVSVFDVVLPDEIPDKGRVLTGLSHFWFERTRDIVANHVISADPDRLPRDRRRRRRPGDARADDAADPARVRRARLPVRRRLAGVPERRERSAASRCPAGLRQAERLPEPLFTPTTKAESGHDLPLDARRGDRRSSARSGTSTLRDAVAARCTSSAPRHADDCGVILADTKFEFGELDDQRHRHRRDDDARLVALLARRRRTASAASPPSFDKQYVRDFMDATGWDHEPPAPRMSPRRDREHARPLPRGVRAASPARASTTGSAPTTRERDAARCVARGGSCRTAIVSVSRSARQPAATADLPERAAYGSVDGSREDRRSQHRVGRGAGRGCAVAREHRRLISCIAELDARTSGRRTVRRRARTGSSAASDVDLSTAREWVGSDDARSSTRSSDVRAGRRRTARCGRSLGSRRRDPGELSSWPNTYRHGRLGHALAAWQMRQETPDETDRRQRSKTASWWHSDVGRDGRDDVRLRPADMARVQAAVDGRVRA